jgi:hypothetical protein
MAFQGHYNLYNYADTKHAWEVWKTIFLDIANMHAPLRIRKVKSEHCPRMSNERKNLAHQKFYLKQKAVKLNSSNYLEAFKSCRNELTKIIKAATNVQFYNTKLQNSKNSREGWNTLNNLLNLTGNPKPQLLMTWTVEKM